MLLEPAREALVQVCASRLGQRVVGGVANQEMPEAECVVLGQRRESSAGRAPSERGASAVQGWPDRPARAPGPRRDGRPALRQRRVRGPRARRSEAGRGVQRAALGSSAAQRPLPRVSPAPSRASARRTADCLRPRRECARACRRTTRLSRASRSINSSVSLSVRGSRSTVVAFSLPPPHAGRSSSRSGRARQSTSSGASRAQSVTCSIRSRNVGSAHWRSSKRTTSGRRAGGRFEEPPHRKRNVVGDRVALAEERAIAAFGTGSPARSCFTTSTTGQ